MITKQYIIDYLKDTLSEDIFLVEVKIGSNQKIRVDLDKMDGIKLEECLQIHKQLYAEIEKNTENFELEVSSPGLSGNLRVWQQYSKIVGNEINLTTQDGLNFTGKLNYADQNQIKIQKSKEEELTLSYNEIKKAKQVIKF